MRFGTFQRKNDDILKLKLIILLEMVEIWICITVIAKLLILLVLKPINEKRPELALHG